MSDLIKREDAIKAEADRVYKVLHSEGCKETYEECLADAEKTFKDIPSAENKGEWIPCSERLPKDGRYYVTRIDYVTNTIFTDILWYEKGIWWNRQYTGDFAVIACMPLPAPYKEQTMTLSEFAKALAEQLESEGATYEDLVRIQEEVKTEVREEGADDE